MKLINAIALGVAGIAVYKLLTTQKAPSPEQQIPEALTPNNILNADSLKPIVEIYDQILTPKNNIDSVKLNQSPGLQPGAHVPEYTKAIEPELVTAPSATNTSPVNAIESNSQEPAFYSLGKRTQDTLLRNFSRDYTSPRMLDDEKDYSVCIKAANATGAPCAWVQFVGSVRKNSTFEQMCFLSDQMLSVFESMIESDIDIADARESAIRHALSVG